MALTNYQMDYDGLTFGAGTDIRIEQVSGLEDFDTSVADTNIPRSWGDVPGLHVVTSREATLELYCTDDVNWRILLDKFQPASLPLRLAILEPGLEERFVYARPIGRAFVRNPIHKFKKMVSIRLKLADPRMYAAIEQGEVVNIYDASGGGLDYDVDYSKEYVGAASTGEALIDVGGNTEAHPLLRVYGPTVGTVTGFTITNITTGQTFESTTDLLTGQILSADMRRLVTVDSEDPPPIHLGGSTRYGDWQLPREPFVLALGENLLRFEVTGTSTDAQCVITYRDTWL